MGRIAAMLLYRIAPEGFWAAADPDVRTALRILYSDPFETLPGGWEFGRDVDRATAALLIAVAPEQDRGDRPQLRRARQGARQRRCRRSRCSSSRRRRR